MPSRREPARRDGPPGDDLGQVALPLDDDVFALAWTEDVAGLAVERPATAEPPLPPAVRTEEDWDDDRWDVPGQGELFEPGQPEPTQEDPPQEAAEEGEPSPSPHGRAGRNLPAAIGVGVGLAGLVLVTLLTYKPAFVVVVLVAILIGTREVVGALRAGGAAPPLVPVLVASGAMVLAGWFGGGQALATGLLLAVLALAAVVIARDPRALRRDLPAAAFAVAYVGFLAGFAMLLLRPDDGVMRVVIFISVTVASDIGGYATGVLSGGRHKLAPGISPGKSWEGLGGSLALCGLVSAILVSLGLDGSALAGIVVGLGIAVTATVGDLGESVLKRDVGIKDMGSLLPGHGGLMDRLDSLLVVAPVAWAALELVVPTS